MTQTTTWKCDRCRQGFKQSQGKRLLVSSLDHIALIGITPGPIYVQQDLCSECFQSLKRWLENKDGD